MRVLVSITYYRPHVSGLTIYVERLARGLVTRGHTVTVLTSRYDRTLPMDEYVDGVRVCRVPVAARVSKGVLMPSLGVVATRLARSHDVLSIHLPQFDAAGIALRGRYMRKPTILTYHCDLQLPPGPFNRIVDQVVFSANYAAGQLADRIVAYTQDYADHSRLLSRFKEKIVVIPPPVVMNPPAPSDVSAFAARRVGEHGPVIGFAARLATEKGVEYLVRAMPRLLDRFPRLKVLFAGPYDNVLGEEAYWERLRPEIEQLDGHWEFVGTLSPVEMSPFFGACDVLVVPSLNSTESFGLVQVEAMLCGTPVVASDLPGVRQPVRMTGMGEVVPVADTGGLAEGIEKVLDGRQRYVRPRADIEALFDLDRTLSSYEELFGQEIRRLSGTSSPRVAA
jgi:glycosyltransferase involved in cell wall biosynthesis